VLGSVFGNLEDQRAADHRGRYAGDQAREYRDHHDAPYEERYAEAGPGDPPQRRTGTQYAAPEPQVLTQPPGEWVRVPGHWEGNVWVPAHQEWRPIRPESP
jgi:hypothetical protein